MALRDVQLLGHPLLAAVDHIVLRWSNWRQSRCGSFGWPPEQYPMIKAIELLKRLPERAGFDDLSSGSLV